MSECGCSKTWASINGVKYDTVIKNGAQRFQENRIVSRLVDWAARAGYDLNRIWLDYQQKSFTREEMRELYRLMGYSVCGFDELFGPNSDNHPDLIRDGEGSAVGGWDEVNSSEWK